MAEPTDYERGYSFTDYQADRPSKPLPGDELDNELDNIATALGETQTALRDVRRSDGKLQNGIVGADALNATAVGALIGQSEALMEDVVFITQMYLGQLPADPDEGRDGAELTEANWYFNTTSNSYRFWNGASWEPLSGTGTMQTYFYVATAGQTIIEGNDANGNAHNALPGAAVLSMNGAVLVYGRDYTIPTAGRIVLAAAAAADDEFTVITFTSLSMTDIGKIQVASFTGDGVTTTFPLPGSVVSATNVRVSLDGVHQHRGQYTVSGSTFTMNEAPPLGSAGEVEVYALLPLGSATASQIELDGGNDVQSWVDARPKTLGDFGAVGDGAADDTSALQAAAAWMLSDASHRIEDYSAGTYKISATISGTGSPRWVTPNAAILVAADVPAFAFTAPTSGPYALSADYVTGALTIAYNGDVQPYAGQRVKIASNALDPAARDKGSNSEKYRQGEQFFVAAGSTSATLALTAPLRFFEGVDRTPAAGDEALVDAYTVANSARVWLLDDALVAFDPGTLAYEDGHDADWNAPAVTFTGHGGGEIDLKVTRGYAQALRLIGCYGVTARVDARNLNDNTSIGQNGYAVATAGCLNCEVQVRAVNVRHAYTSSTAAQASGSTALGVVLGQGRDVGVRVVGGYGAGVAAATPFDTHHESQDATFERAVADGCGEFGLTIRGVNVQHLAPQVRNCAGGALVYTEYDSGDPDDDYFTNSKTARHLTSAVIDSPDFATTGECFDVSAARLTLTGSGRYATQTPRWMLCDNGAVRVDGSHIVTVGAEAGTAGHGLIHVIGAAGGGAVAGLVSDALGGAAVIVEAGAVVEIDARAAGVVPVGLKTETGGRIVVRGTLRLLLPAGATLMSGDAGSIVCEGAGRIEYSIGGVTSVVPTGLAGSRLEFLGADGATYRTITVNSGGALLSDGGPIPVPSFTSGTLPPAAAYAGATVFISDASGGASLAFSDGDNWRNLRQPESTTSVVIDAVDNRDTVARDLVVLATDVAGYAVGVTLDGYFVGNGVEVRPSDDRDGLGAFIDGVAALDGVAWGIRADGSIELFDQVVTPAVARDAMTEHVPVAYGAGNKLALGLTTDGIPIAADWAVHAAVDRDDMTALIPVAMGRDGVSLAVDPSTGAAHFPTAPQGAMYHPASDMRGNWGQFNVRPGGHHVYATVQTRGHVCDVMQRRDLTVRDTAVAVGGIETWLVIGQSNAGPGSGPSGPPPIIVSDWPHHVLDAGYYGYYGNSDAQVYCNASYDLRPAEDPASHGQSPALMLGLALADIEHGAHDRVAPRVFHTSWEGGRNLSDFFPGAGRYIYENLEAGMLAAQRIGVTGYSEPTVTAVLFIQGENMTPGYQAEFEDWIDEAIPALAMAAGQPAPHLLYRQINSGSDATSAPTNDVPAAQMAVARSRLGAGVTMTGPMYHLPLHDTIHADNIGRMIGGEMDAHAWRVVRGGGVWHPLWPVPGGATRSGTVITIPMDLPPGCDTLSLDDDWVPTDAHYGFRYSDNSSGATISSVTISGSNVVITLSVDPGSATGKVIDYARYNADPLTGWAGGRGGLYCDTHTPSPYHTRGYAVPPTIRAYCARFRETVS